ncbi:hypothetical protein E8E14_007932 [Neopestalotiopsis sp. 37M]|nr:hypothetical protein E8E14_007932 [Neopestalotiopsis sp. 37M]
MLEHIGRDCPRPPIHRSLRVRPVRPGRRGRPRAQPPAEPLRCRLYDRNYMRLECANYAATAPYFGLPATPLALPAPAITAAEDEEEEEEDEDEEEEEREVKKEEDEKEEIKEAEEKEIKEEGEE